ncbi:hypothetical protein C8R45DRAFT_1098986 [Mycena sanguinolenta]|nr:hypothetical protein C8R45DRAFT_1098986 [Mycena sanguinolenta]
MSTDQRNNGNTAPPSNPSGNKDKDKNPETEEREEEVTEEEKKQQKLEALMRILDVKEKKANKKLERIRCEREHAGALSQDIKAHRLNNDGEAELADLLRGLSPRWSEVSNEMNNESTSEEDVYQAPSEKDGGKKRRRVERKREKKGKGKQLGRQEKRRKTERTQPETEDPEESSCQLCTQVSIECLWPPVNSRKKACRYCRLRKVKCSNLPENENRQPTVRHRIPEDLEIAWAHRYLHGIGENTDGESESSEEEEETETEETKRVRSWVKKVGASEKVENPQSEDRHGGVDGDGDVTEVVPSTETMDGPTTFGSFGTTSDGTVFHVNLESTTVVVKTEEEESGILRDNEEDLARRGQLRKKNKLNAKAKAKEAEKPTEEGAEKVVKTEEQETQGPVTVQPSAPRIVQAPGVFFETATSTSKLIPVQVEMIEVLNSDDEAPAL